MLTRSNDEWVRALRASGADNEIALRDVREYLVAKLRYVLRGKTRGKSHLAEDIAQEAVVKVIGGIDGFRGDSRFTTWALRIAINLAYTELRHARWEDVSLDVFPADELQMGGSNTKRSGELPEDVTMRNALVQALNSAMKTCLSEYQRRALQAVMNTRMPMGEVALRLGTNRNALYKVLYDARAKLKRALLDAGFTEHDI